MVEWTDDLFLVDAEAACRDLISYGQSNDGMSIARVEGTVEYLLTLMPVVGLELHIQWLNCFKAVISELDDGTSRRFARDLGEWLLLCLDQIKQGEALVDASDLNPELYDRLKARASASEYFLPAETDPGRVLAAAEMIGTSDFIDEAVQTIQAADAFAGMMLRPASDRRETDQLPAGVPQSGGEALKEELTVDPDVLAVNPLSEVSPLQRQSVDLNDQWDYLGNNEVFFDQTADAEPLVFEPLDCLPYGQDDHQLSVELPSLIDEVNPSKLPTKLVNAELDSVAGHTDQELTALPLIDSQDKVTVGLGEETKSSELAIARDMWIRVDDAFRRTLKFLPDERWSEGAQALLEAIDVFDHVELAQVIPMAHELIGGKGILVDWELALGLCGCFNSPSPSRGLIEARLVAHTLLLSVKGDDAVRPSAMAELCMVRGGRFEMDSSNGHYRAVIPASKRLLRVAPALLRDEWIAISWSQLMSTDTAPGVRALELQLRLGSDMERVIVRELGTLQVGVFYPLGAGLRKRDRFRGVVRLPNGQTMPVFA
jgi:hypothetical protein